MERRNEYLRIFFSKCFHGRCKHTEVALTFIPKQNSLVNQCDPTKVVFKKFAFRGYSESLNLQN